MVFSICDILSTLTSNPCANAHACNVAFVKSSPYFLTFIPSVSRYFNCHKWHGLDYLIAHMGLLILRMVLISTLLPHRIVVRPSIKKTPILLSVFFTARHGIVLFVHPHITICGFSFSS